MAQIILCGGIAVVPYIRPVGVYQLANVLRQQGYTVQVIDQFPWVAHMGIETVLKLFDKFVGPETLWIGYSSNWLRRIKTLKPGPEDHLAGTVHKKTDTLREETLLFSDAELLRIKKFVLDKNPNVKFVLGGARSGMGRRGIYKPLIDYCIEGYADNTVVAFSRWLDGTGPKPPMEPNQKGLYGEGTTWSLTHDHKAAGFDYYNFQFRWDESDLVNPGETLPMEIARGCMFSCAFCSYPLNGRRKMDYLKNPEVLRAQFIDNYNRFGTTNYFFLDDTFNDSVEKLQILHDEVFAKLPFKVSFGAFMRLDLINAHRETIPLLRDMGLTGAFLGIETLNEASNRSIGKGISREKIVEILTILYKEWPNTILDGQFIMGLPHDSEETIREWLDLLLTPEFPLHAAKIEPLHLDSRKGAKDGSSNAIWISKFESDPESYGYTFDETQGPHHWTNNMGFSLSDAIRVKAEYGKKWKVKEKSAWVGDYGLMNIGISPDVVMARRDANGMEDPTKFRPGSDFITRTRFVENYVKRLLNL
jgi:hypothetical protein